MIIDYITVLISHVKQHKFSYLNIIMCLIHVRICIYYDIRFKSIFTI